MTDRSDITDAELNEAIQQGRSDAAEAGSAPTAEPFPATAGDTWARPWPDREWLIPGWLPAGRLGMLSGRGGRGKSRLALQLAARVAAGRPADGVFVPPASSAPGASVAVDGLHKLDAAHAGPVVYASWEDERDEAGRRIAALERDGLATAADLAGRLRFIDLRGEGPLWGPDDGSRSVSAIAALTLTGRRVRATCEAMDARLLIVDSLAGAYGGDENVRALVRAFCADWDGWASGAGCAVMLISHPPKTPSGGGAGAVDRDYAGSTDWHAAARWRWTLEPADTGERAKVDGKSRAVPALALTLAKASYGPDGWRVFVTPSGSRIGWQAVTPAKAAEDVAGRNGWTLAGGDDEYDD